MKRRRYRRRKRNLNPTRTEWVEITGGAAASLATLFISPRIGGLLGGGTAVYSALEGHRTRGIVVGIISALVFFSPEIRGETNQLGK